MAVVAACGGSPTAVSTDETVVAATDYATFPPPTTTIAPTTTLPPEPGSIISAEATYVVIEGDYPFQVAARFGVDFEEFVALNGWTIVDGVVPEWPAAGTTIRIPAGAEVPGGPSVLVPVPTAAPDPLASIAPGSSMPSESPTTVNDGVGCGIYTVLESDYPGLVATKLNTTVDKLAEANETTSGYDAFYIGLGISIPC